jgi:hypothetical protein
LTVELAATSIDFVGGAVSAVSTGPGTVQVGVNLGTADYGRVALDINQPVGGFTGLTIVQFDYVHLDPNTRWNAANYWWNLPAGVYEIGANITCQNNPAEYAVRLINQATGQILAIANTIAHQIGDLEHTTHVSTIVQLLDASSRIMVQLDTPYQMTGYTINGAYIGYVASDNNPANRVLTDFWYHRL